MNPADPNEQTVSRQLNRPALALAATLAIWCSAASPAFAQKTDVVELINGDRITCEIQKLVRGKLSVKTDGLGTISIEWDDVARVTSTAAYDVELESGSRVSGTLARGEARAVQVVTAAGPEPVALATIVRVSRLGRTFFRRLDGSIATGFSFAQADVQTQWTFDADIDYRSRNWLIGLTADSMVTAREDVDSQKRGDLILQAQRFFRPRWSYMALGVAQRNEELSLDLRWAAGGGLVRVFKQTNQTALQAELGLAYTHEQYQRIDRPARGRGHQRGQLGLVHLRWQVHQPLVRRPVVHRPRTRLAAPARDEHYLQERYRRRPLLERERVRELQQRPARQPEGQRLRRVGHPGLDVLTPAQAGSWNRL